MESKRLNHLTKLTWPQLIKPDCPILNPSDPNGDSMVLATAVCPTGF